MAFLRIKRIKKQSYLYLVKSIWSKKKQRASQKVIKYYGKIDNGHIDDNIVYKRDNHECQRCHSKERLVIDYKIPLTMGGKDEYSNVWVLCEQCNRIKQTFDHNGDKIDKKYHLLTQLKFYIQAFENKYKRRQKELGKKFTTIAMKKSVMQKKKIREIMTEIKNLGIDKELRYDGYL